MKRNILLVLVSLFFVLCVFSTVCYAQLWKAIPPYNVLWPLWSPILSPPNPLTGIPTPLVSTLTPGTILPVQPAFVWDPRLPYFYPLYNYTPVDATDPQLLFFDPTEGAFNPIYAFTVWPPANLLQAVTTTTFTGTTTTIGPAPIALPANYASLVSFDPGLWLNFWIPIANNGYQNLYGIFPNLLTAADILAAGYVFSATYTPPI